MVTVLVYIYIKKLGVIQIYIYIYKILSKIIFVDIVFFVVLYTGISWWFQGWLPYRVTILM